MKVAQLGELEMFYESPVADGRQLAQALNAHLEEIRTGHPSVLEAHETLARLIVNFLAA